MTLFNVGDKVALIHEKSAGIVTKVQENLVTVYIEDMDMDIEIDAKLIMLIEKSPTNAIQAYNKTQNIVQEQQNEDITKKINTLIELGIGYQTSDVKKPKKQPNLPTEIDLHWEVLQKSNPTYANISETDTDEIFRIQRLEFENFFLQALIHNLNMITIIHGIGSGKLREYIHAYIKRHEKNVDSYQIINDGGVTQIIFKVT
ncbi:MAG: Smr/MutS family protein [Bacteroidia bacterium]|nr:Smr/MutS family protein [Bacteroidia bacterium]MDW8348601.1 Smr/MutS family protein [Bacteroidia bacterium]